MEVFDNLMLGLATAATPINLVVCLTGVMLGTLIGILPGLGPLAAISILLPMSMMFGDPITALIFMSGLFYGTQYGGSTTAILMNMPGEATSVVTAIDGYQMTRKGRSGAALAIAAWSSFFAGTVATFLIVLVGVPLSEMVFWFGPTEYTALMLLALVACASLSPGSLIAAMAMTCLGILLGLIGTDTNSGLERFVFDIPELVDGISFGIIAMGMFGLSELLYSWLHPMAQPPRPPPIGELYPDRAETKKSIMPTVRGTTIGSILGMLPGGGAVMASFAGYALEKKISKDPGRFGQGAPEGVAGPESANNAGAQTSFIPLLSLGLPFTPIMSIMMSVMIFNGIQPGPQVIESNPALFWGLVVSMWIGNLMLLILNLPLIGIWVKILEVPRRILYPIIISICVLGAYYITYNWVGVLLLIPFAVLGYVFKLLDCSLAPLAMGFVIGKMFEEYFRRSMLIGAGEWTIFLERPITVALFVSTAVIIAAAVIWQRRSRTT